MRILVIEDSDSIRHMIETLVSARGHRVTAVSSGAKGIDAALSEAPDAILLDLYLPGSYDGYSVCRMLRSNPATATTPIIVISAVSDEAARVKAFELGATAFYTKPFSPIALLKELDALYRRSIPDL